VECTNPCGHLKKAQSFQLTKPCDFGKGDCKVEDLCAATDFFSYKIVSKGIGLQMFLLIIIL
jgi:hypothetical protein